MRNIKGKSYLKYLFWLGPILSIMGLTAQAVSGAWSPISLGLLTAGLVIIGLWLLFLDKLAPGFWGRRSTQVGTNAVVATLAMIAVLALVNFLGIRYSVRWDLTENQLFTLSPQSQEIVRNLEQPVKLWIFDPVPNPTDREILRNYRRYGSKFEFEFVDPQVNLGLAEKFKVNAVGEVYLEYGSQRKLVQRVNATERLQEIPITNAIESITSDRNNVVYFLQGHGELALEGTEGAISQAVNILTEKNFTPQPLNLAQRTEVPQDASVVVIAGAKRGLFASEVTALSQYLAKGGSLLLMVDPDRNLGLDSLLADWGITLDTRIVVDASEEKPAALGPAIALVTSYGDHPITKRFGNGYSFYPLARPIETKTIPGIQSTSLIMTNQESWAENNPEEQPLEFNEQKGDRPGPLVLGVALNRQAGYSVTSNQPQPSPTPTPTTSPTTTSTPSPSPTSTPSPTPTTTPTPSPAPTNTEKVDNNQNKSESRLVVYGNSTFASDGAFEQQLNSDVFLNSVSWLSKRDDKTLSIRPKQPENRRIELTSLQAGLLGWTSLAIVPLFGFSTAGIIWWIRR
ncbi:MAG TPA: ABC transporter [Cyanobacteria bacterium UBA11149]|nr:ABC transporter [Cyanobacteria bacterium UBA11367]HBE58957.1 ABC transporter [Cyanobacteria bacterium UBA11366]HBK62657.1 ABC transporter [Cyanobacteria bacterium UBA11166]HBR75552.1 ABC transporter [Cyanobacteria bacterium UBA11159]HBS70272.1 ABC transporter [Cyanobacteria bacterium UBA11153]HBW91598.1 ABC transporter [Cyanobacteria bacterium UBA11149]HCA98047.1 ABC transporter [Cyanobacteria bacterium UBA9226]